MDYRDIIQRSLDYIEDNLRTDITPAELADMAGFSLYHYYRLFQGFTGLPVKQYILRRRLLHGIYAMHRGSSGIDAALSYGFDTYAGFYRAFLREFGSTPAGYLSACRSRQPCRVDLSKEEHMTVTHKKASEILKHWNLENETVTDVYYEETGEKNHRTFYVGTQYVLKYSSDPTELRLHADLSRAIDRQGLLAAVPVLTPDGREFVQEGPLHFCLTRRVPGRQFQSGTLYGPGGLETAEFMGRILGLLHQALEDVDVPADDIHLPDLLENWALDTAAEHLKLSPEFRQPFLHALKKLYPLLPRQIIHRDPNPSNMILHNGQWGFLDFDLSEKNIRIYDLCYAATAVLSESFSRPDREEWLGILRSMVRGYDSTAHLSDAERAAIPYVILSNQFICVAWFAQQGQYPEILETNIAMTHWLLELFTKQALF